MPSDATQTTAVDDGPKQPLLFPATEIPEMAVPVSESSWEWRDARRLITTACCAAILLGITSDRANALFGAGDIVFDPANFEQAVQHVIDDAKAYALQLQGYVLQLKQYAGEELSWVKQAAQYATQLEQYAQEVQLFLNFVHYPSIGAAMGILNQAGLGSSLPVNPNAVMSLVNGLRYGQGGFGEITGILSSLSSLAGPSWSMNHVYTPTDGSWASQQIIAAGNGTAGMQGAMQSGYADLQTHAAALQALRTHLGAAEDTKDVLDTTAQISLEGVWTANQSARMNATAATYAAQRDALLTRDNERLDHDIEGWLQTNPQGGVPAASGIPGVGGPTTLATPPDGDPSTLPVPPVPAPGSDFTTPLPTPPVPPASTDTTMPAADPALDPTLSNWTSTPTPAPMNLNPSTTPPPSLTDVPNIAPGVPAPPGAYDNVVDPPLTLMQ